MDVRFHPHARTRLAERGGTEEEAVQTIASGQRSPAKHGRTRFRKDFVYNGNWRGKHYDSKQVEVIAVREGATWLVITTLVRFF